MYLELEIMLLFIVTDLVRDRLLDLSSLDNGHDIHLALILGLFDQLTS